MSVVVYERVTTSGDNFQLLLKYGRRHRLQCRNHIAQYMRKLNYSQGGKCMVWNQFMTHENIGELWH